jgi:hypothetical protein
VSKVPYPRIKPFFIAVGGTGVRPDVVPVGSVSGRGGTPYQQPPNQYSGGDQAAGWENSSPHTRRRTETGGGSSRAEVVSLSDVRLEHKEESGTPSRLSVNNSSGRPGVQYIDFQKSNFLPACSGIKIFSLMQSEYRYLKCPPLLDFNPSVTTGGGGNKTNFNQKLPYANMTGARECIDSFSQNGATAI